MLLFGAARQWGSPWRLVGLCSEENKQHVCSFRTRRAADLIESDLDLMLGSQKRACLLPKMAPKTATPLHHHEANAVTVGKETDRPVLEVDV